MREQMLCPHCGKSIIPIEKWVIVWDKTTLRKHIISGAVTGTIGLLMVVFGLIIFILSRLSTLGLAGLATAILGLFILVSLVLRFTSRARNKRHQQVCPLCKYRWIGQGSEGRATEGLESYFTDVEQLRAEFESLVASSKLSRRLLIVHGVGGTGKSSLLRMFRLHCRKIGVIVALCSGDEAKSPVDILSDWAKDFTMQGITLPTFTRTLNEYRTIQRTVEQKSQGDMSKTAIKMGVQTTSSLVGIIPVVGLPLSMVLGGTSDTLVDWLHGFLSKPQINLLLDPTDELTECFLDDLGNVIRQQGTNAAKRIVLLLDTLERITALSGWICDFAKRLHPEVLLVCAGRLIPDWEEQWPGWTAQAMVEELKPMNEEVMRRLVRRYYATQREGEPDPLQVEAIIRFARGLPMAATNTVQLWVQYGAEEFHSVRAQIVADLVDQLTRGVPERMRPTLKAAATLRWFNKELLSVVGGDSTLSDVVYEELRRFPVVRSHKKGLVLHDSVREHLDDNLRVHEPNLHREMHRRAAAYFEAQLQTVMGEETTDLILEELYHEMMANEDEGNKHFRKLAGELVSYQLLEQLRTLLNDVNNYALQKENSRQWQEYYRARLMDLEGRQVEAVPLYQAIAENPQTERILRAYALCDWAWSIRWADHGRRTQILERFHMLFPEPDAMSEPDAKLSLYLLEVAELYQEQGKWNDVLTYLERARKLYERIGDPYWLAFTYTRIMYCYVDRGMWKEGLEMQQRGLQEVEKLVGEKQQSFIKAELLGGYSIGWMWAGRYRETEEHLRKALSLAEQFERVQQQIYFKRDLALVLGLQGKVQEAMERFTASIETGQRQDPLYTSVTEGFQGIVAMQWSSVEEAEGYLTSCLDGLKQQVVREWETLTFLNWFGVLHEIKGMPELAERAYRNCLDMRHLEQWYWHAKALTGLVRIYSVKGDSNSLAPVLQEAEVLAQQYEYNDHLAALRLSRGHFAWDKQDEVEWQRFDTALHYYQQALIFAVHYNRFLLDEVLSGRPQGTPLQSIIPHCLERGDEGLRMLNALHEWWQSGSNDTGSPKPESISQLSEGVPLLDCEQLARRQEPGDGAPQQTVVEQLESAIYRKRG